MKREFLKNLDIGDGAKLSDAAIDAIMAEYGKAKNASDQTIQTLTTERDGLRGQLSDANVTIQSYKDMDIDGIKRKAEEWERKYDTDTKKLKADLEAAEYGHMVKDAASGLQFSSESARRAFVADLTAKKLPLQDGKLLGLDDFVSAYKESDPNAFAPEGRTPVVVSGGSGSPATGFDDSLRAAFGLSRQK